MKSKPADTGIQSYVTPTFYETDQRGKPGRFLIGDLLPPPVNGKHADDLIRVEFEGRILEFAQIETGALQKEAREKRDLWYGFSRFALFTRPADNNQLRRVLEILTRQGWGGRIVADGIILGLPEWKVRFQINPDEMTYDRAIYAVVEVSYRAERKDVKGKVDTTGDVWKVTADA